MKNSIIIVTGSAGFIGSNIVAELEEAGYKKIVCVDWFGKGNKWLNVAKRSIYQFVMPEELSDFLDQHKNDVGCIVHMGAISSTTETDADLLVKNNVNYSVMLWDKCSQYQIPFIYASSAATYGAEEVSFKDNDDIEFLSQLRPLNPYGWSKNATDIIFTQHVRDGKKPSQWAGLKFFNVYGPNEYHKEEMTSVITKFFQEAQTWHAVKLFKSDREDIADGEQKRDFVYVKDCCKIILWLMENPQVNGIYNVGTGLARSFLDVAKAINHEMNDEIEISFRDMPDHLKGKYQYHTQADMSKLRAQGMNSPFFSLEEGVADYLNNYLKIPDSYR
ncbi:MAG: ADP-glyceromanno-heptose 6-epimerase [Saezia sp.]